MLGVPQHVVAGVVVRQPRVEHVHRLVGAADRLVALIPGKWQPLRSRRLRRLVDVRPAATNQADQRIAELLIADGFHNGADDDGANYGTGWPAERANSTANNTANEFGADLARAFDGGFLRGLFRHLLRRGFHDVFAVVFGGFRRIVGGDLAAGVGCVQAGGGRADGARFG